MSTSYSEFRPRKSAPGQRIERNKQEIRHAERQRRKHQWLAMAFISVCLGIGSLLLVGSLIDDTASSQKTTQAWEPSTDAEERANNVVREAAPAAADEQNDTDFLIDNVIAEIGNQTRGTPPAEKQAQPAAKAAVRTSRPAPQPAAAPASPSKNRWADSSECCAGCDRPLGGPGRAGARTGSHRSATTGQGCS